MKNTIETILSLVVVIFQLLSMKRIANVNETSV